MVNKIEIDDSGKVLTIVDVEKSQFRRGYNVVSFSLEKNNTTVLVEEEADNYMASEFNKKEFQELISSLQKLADMMIIENMKLTKLQMQ